MESQKNKASFSDKDIVLALKRDKSSSSSIFADFNSLERSEYSPSQSNSNIVHNASLSVNTVNNVNYKTLEINNHNIYYENIYTKDKPNEFQVHLLLS